MKSSKNQVLDRCFCMPRAADRDLCYLLWAAATVPRWAASPCRGVSNVGNLTGEDRGNYAGKMVMYGDFIFFFGFQSGFSKLRGTKIGFHHENPMRDGVMNGIGVKKVVRIVVNTGENLSPLNFFSS